MFPAVTLRIDLTVNVFEENPEISSSEWGGGVESNQERTGEEVFRPQLDGCGEREGVRIF